MKVVALFFSLMSFFTSCKCNKTATDETLVSSKESTLSLQTSNLPTVVYQETTRGRYRKITISEGSIYVITAHGAKPVFWVLKKDDSQKLFDLFQKIDLEKLSTLKAPTEKRFYDGAPIANISFTTEKQTYASTDFDGGFPPAAIEAFVNELIVVAEKLNN
ncbi:hypothetical protein [Flavobacterium channae]|uniref:hypothetical protein n=1 Tax=Flavobacterium channae TaxID=2897181 RepID=UPI001E6527A9|nr:hypothetical protein [Flavobacterium channae]UGS23718.1 hypothetical protein LOS89_00235 [Flavobacterium channae]